ncbi:MAG: peptide deformylase [Elusimicrobia bacterium]|nr:peptide deformylase [Elusimicrobiota bacterium]
MATLRITKHGEDVLKRVSEPVDFDKLKKKLPGLLKDMWATMYGVNGVGLAAPQIGLNIRLAIIDVRPDQKPQRLVLINPEIVSKEGGIDEEEGCLSVPGLYAKVKRYARVRIRATDHHGKPYEMSGEGLLARAFQHEIDHLDGKLFIDHLSLTERLRVARILKDLRLNWT